MVSQSKAAQRYVPAVSTACCFAPQLLRRGHAHFAYILDLLTFQHYIFVDVLKDIVVQAWYPGAMRNQTADAKYDWGLLVVLIAVEMRKQQPLTELTGQSAPTRVQLPLVLARCRAIVHRELKQLVEQFIHKAGWL